MPNESPFNITHVDKKVKGNMGIGYAELIINSRLSLMEDTSHERMRHLSWNGFPSNITMQWLLLSVKANGNYTEKSLLECIILVDTIIILCH